jgi:serine/threonine-protein kinase
MGRLELAAARDEGGAEKLCALKRLHPQLAGDARVREIYLDEARIAAAVRHPHLVEIHEVGEDRAGPFVAMEYVDGVSAAALIARSAQRQQPLPIQICARIVAQAARGIHAAHVVTAPDGKPRGLLHRDLCPQHLLVGFDGIVRVIDLGVARALDDNVQTSTGVIRAKSGYRAPERLRQEPYDRRSDIFSLGVVLYELLVGRRLYEGRDTNEIAQRILTGGVPDIGEERDDAPLTLVELLFRMLAKDPAARPESADAVAQALEELSSELADEQFLVELVPYLASAFAEERATMAQRIAAATAGGPIPLPGGVDGGEAPAISTSARPPAPPRRSLLVLAGTAAAGAVAAPLLLRARRGARGAPHGPIYDPGFIWTRAADWRPGLRAGATSGNPAIDGKGRPAWRYEYVEGGGGLHGSDPWYARPAALLRWSDRFGRRAALWTRGPDLGPGADRSGLVHRLDPAHVEGAPVVRWTNPTGRPVTLDLVGALGVSWEDGARGAVELAVVRYVGAAHRHDLVTGQTVQPGSGPTSVRVRRLGLRLEPDDSILISMRGQGTSGCVGLTDQIKLVLLEDRRQA